MAGMSDSLGRGMLGVKRAPGLMVDLLGWKKRILIPLITDFG